MATAYFWHHPLKTSLQPSISIQCQETISTLATLRPAGIGLSARPVCSSEAETDLVILGPVITARNLEVPI